MIRPNSLRDFLVAGTGVTAVATALLAAGSASAQDAAATTASTQTAAAAPQASGLSDIIVTARKRAESVQDVPVAVSAISAATIKQRDLTSLEKIAAATPEFTVGRASNGSGAQLTLRGIGSSSTSIGIEQSVATVVDGVYYGQGRVINEGFFDLSRVEILKGPQALFFGKNATAGVISLTTADPGDKPELIARSAYEFGSQQIQGELIGSTPITDTLGIRVALRGSKMFGGYYDNDSQPFNFVTTDIATGKQTSHLSQPSPHDAPGEKELLGRITLKWTPTTDITDTLKVSGDYDHVNNNSWNYVAFQCVGGVSHLTGQACGDHFVTYQNKIPADIAQNFPYAKSDGSLYDRYKSWAVTNTLIYKLPSVTLTNVTNYNWNNNRFACACDFQSAGGSNWATENSTWHALSTELRAQTSFDGPINLMVGGYYQKTKRTFGQYIILGNVEDSTQSAANRYIGTSKTSYTNGETFAGFGQVTWKIVPTLEATGGVRYTHETKDSFFTQPYNNAAVTAIFRPENSPDGLGVITAHQVFNNWSPEATLSWKPIHDIMIYGAYKTNYKSGGFSNGGINSGFSTNPFNDLTFAPEKARGFEAGIKSELFDRQLRLNLTGYTYAYKNLQVDFFNSPIFAFQTLTADARTKGVELEAEYAPHALQGLNLHGSINYNKARYTSFPQAPCYAGETPTEGCNLVFNGTNFTRQSLTGKSLSMAPHWTGSLGATYSTSMGRGLRFGISADARYSSSYNASAFGTEDARQKGYVSFDASARISTDNDRWEVALVGKNLTNHFYVTGVVDGPSTGSGTGTAAGVHADQLGFGTLPRTVQMQVTFHY
jgi:iron complex outermembrane receptor protein